MIKRLVALKIAAAILLFPGCAHRHAHVVAPSTAAVQGGIDQAQAFNQAAQRYNDVASGIAGRIDAKTQVIIKYWDTSK